MIGKTVAHYKILEELGRGGMGIVYKAKDTKLDRTVALKFLTPQILGSGEEKMRFIHEAKTAASLSHPNICTIFEIDETEGRSFIAMEYVEGQNLKETTASGPLDVGHAIDIAIWIAQGLHAAHEKGIVHRDIKSANIMITSGGQIKIMDFGLAISAGMTKLTREGTTLGTVSYMSPEQAQGEGIDHRTDIWSLGVILYEMLTGQQPFRGDYDQAVIYSIIHDDPKPITGLRTGLPLALERLVNKTLSKTKAERYQHADEVLADLTRIRRELESSNGRVRPGTTAIRPTRKRMTATILTIAVICALVIGFFILKPFLFEEPLISAPVPIAVISFENQTGDPEYDYLQTVIPNLLITSLEQSKHIRVATWERLQDLQEQIGKGNEQVIDKELGFELCRLDGIRAIAFGSFTKAGDVFVTDIKVLDVDSKELLKSASAQGRGVGSILEKQIDELSREVSRGIGLPERTRNDTEVRIAEVTTTSMEAYNYFIRGREDYYKFYLSDALKFLGKALAIDSTFAAAHLFLGDAYATLGNTKASLEAFRRAKSLSGKTSEKEKLIIEAAYAMYIEHDLDKQFYILMKIAEKYPKEKGIHNELARYYSYSRGRHDDAIAEYEKVLALDPNHAATYNSLAYMYALRKDDFEKAMEYLERYASLLPGDANPLDSRGELYTAAGKIDEAISTFEELLEIKSDFAYIGVKFAYLYGLKENYT
ncbi:MAG: protein kinase [bacterium]|nr:MAG: protein kinase [bacterium]